MESSAKWRQVVLKKRQQLDPKFIQDASLKIERRLMGLEEFRLAERIALYAAFRGEVETCSIYQKANAVRKEIFYPAVDVATREIRFCRIRKFDDLAPGFAGIPEPKDRSHFLADINYLDLVIVPGVVFDARGNRVGYGQGYYDRLLANYSRKRAALAYDFQIVDSLPSQPRQQRMDVIVTEERILRIV